MSKFRALTNGNEYQTEDPHLAYPLHITPAQAAEWVALGLLEEIKEPPKPSRSYKRRDMEAEEAATVDETTDKGTPAE